MEKHKTRENSFKTIRQLRGRNCFNDVCTFCVISISDLKISVMICCVWQTGMSHIVLIQCVCVCVRWDSQCCCCCCCCVLREQKDPLYLRDKLSQKHSKEQFEAAQKIEQEYSRFFTGWWKWLVFLWCTEDSMDTQITVIIMVILRHHFSVNILNEALLCYCMAEHLKGQFSWIIKNISPTSRWFNLLKILRSASSASMQWRLLVNNVLN